MSNAIAQRPQNGVANDVIEQVIIQGDLAQLTPEQRVTYYSRVCETVGLNPYTKPFDYIRLNNRLVLYALKGATDQLRRLHGVSASVVSQERIDDVLVVTVEATDKTGRVDTEIGAVSITGLRGEALANAMMKAVTKAKRRVTLSICGLGMLDESEIDTIPSAQHTGYINEIPSQPGTETIVAGAAEVIDAETGEIQDGPRDPSQGHPATDKQLKAIFAIGRNAGWTNDELRAEMVKRFGVEHSRELTIGQASAFITFLEQGSAEPEETPQPQLV